jgi:hypothetical protein
MPQRSDTLHRHTYTKSDWQMFIAAAMPDSDLRDSLISAVKSYASRYALSNA